LFSSHSSVFSRALFVIAVNVVSASQPASQPAGLKNVLSNLQPGGCAPPLRLRSKFGGKNHFEEFTCIQIGHPVLARLALGGRAPIFYCVRTPFENYENLWKIVSQRARRLNLNTGMSVAPVTSRRTTCWKPHTNLSLQFRLEKMPPAFGHAAGPEQQQLPEMQNQQQRRRPVWEEQPPPEEQQRESQPEEQQQQQQQQWQQQQQQQQQQSFNYLNFF
jgi:hypothetical protein